MKECFNRKVQRAVQHLCTGRWFLGLIVPQLETNLIGNVCYRSVQEQDTK